MAFSSSSRFLYFVDCSSNGTSASFLDSSSCKYEDLPIPPIPSDPDPDPDPNPNPIQIHHPSRLLPNFLIAAASLLALSFLLLVVSYFFLRRRRRRRLLLFPAAANNNDNHQNPPFPLQDPYLFDEEEAGGGTHHIWYIRTVGLDESVIKSIAAAVYKSGDGLMDGGDCTVCLGEFVDGEVIKLLPKCSHAFHLSCIDTWLRSHVNCPLCRAPVIVGPAEVDDSGPSEETVSPPSMIANEREESMVVVDLGARSSSSSNSRKEENQNESELQPIRRSVSLDSSSLGVLMLRVELPEKLEEGRKEVEMKEVVVPKNGGKGSESLGKWGAEMKRSLSSRSGRLFFTRYARGRSSSVLPL